MQAAGCQRTVPSLFCSLSQRVNMLDPIWIQCNCSINMFKDRMLNVIYIFIYWDTILAFLNSTLKSFLSGLVLQKCPAWLYFRAVWSDTATEVHVSKWLRHVNRQVQSIVAKDLLC